MPTAVAAMHEAGALWSVMETERDRWWAVEASSGMAYAVAPAIGFALWHDGDPGCPLTEELRRAGRAAEHEPSVPEHEPPAHAERPPSTPAEHEPPTHTERPPSTLTKHEPPTHAVDLELAGVVGRYSCDVGETAARIATEYAACIPSLRSTPDVFVHLDADADIDRLHRAVPDPRRGVRIRGAGERTWIPARADLPALPPFQHTRLAARCAALHAALVITQRGALLVSGGRKSGKTTAALVAGEAGLGTACTDELVLLARGGMVHGVPLPMRVRSADERRVRPIERTSPLERQPVRATDLLLLDPVQGPEPAATRSPAWIGSPGRVAQIDDQERALRLLTDHLRPLAQTLGTTALMALELLAGVTVWRLGCRPWPDLREDLLAGLTEIVEASSCARST